MALNQLLGGSPFPLGFSKLAATELRDAVDRIWNDNYIDRSNKGEPTIKFPDPSVKIMSWTWNGLLGSMQKFETVFSTELGEMTTYFVPSHGIYSTPKLADSADESFPLELHPFIPEKTKVDWRAAGRCVAFNLLSASGFHVARAVEGTMESYYQLFSGKPGKILRSWDDYHKKLAEIASKDPTPAPDPKTLTEFDQMRQDYRNPIVHPRVTLDEADARILFNNGESLIIAMAKELREAARTGVAQAQAVLISGAQKP
ncbi:MAG TPA: hypothetical protein VGR70_06895 [Stellaceae bacterium]|nr:hypothetical protein [Stellaceae bacterium]